MGTPVSKSSENSVSETETEFVTNRPSAKENDITNDLEDTAQKLSHLKVCHIFIIRFNKT